jgi:hypothetical protein
MDAITWNTNGVRELVLTHADLVQELFLENLAGMRIANLAHVTLRCCHDILIERARAGGR